MKRKTTVIGIVAGLAAALVGCRDTSSYFTKVGEYEGYPSAAWINPDGRHVRIDAHKGGSTLDKDKAYIHGLDEDLNGRFEKITLRNLPPGHPLEEHANLATLEEAYQVIEQEGKEL